jgi:acetyltransferase-like isoleucine patch superfamily enzyme
MIRGKITNLIDRCRRGLSNKESALGKYRLLAVGDQDNSALLSFELINTFILPLPGGIGRWLRSLFLPRVCGAFGRSVTIGTDCTIRNPAKIRIGDHTIIEDRVCLDAKPSALGLIIGRGVTVGRRTICNSVGETLSIGDGTRIAPFCRLGSKMGLSIGKGCRIGEEVCFSGAGHAYADRDMPIVLQPATCKGPTFVGDFVTIGDRSTILDGVTIGNNVLIAADSLVNRDIPDNSTAAGVPVRIQPSGD